MQRALLACVPLLALLAGSARAGWFPTMEQVARSPADYAGMTLTFGGATLSGKITVYEVGYVRKYYLTVGSRAGTLEAGFFLAPPSLADKLAGLMNPRQNYAVNLTCRVQRIVINEVPQWHGIVTRVDFLDGDGQVTDTVKLTAK
jgi:hypothetical protein